MLTILAWMVFIPALAWNTLIFFFILKDAVGNRNFKYPYHEQFQIALSVVVLIVPSVYLFGWF